MNGFTFLSIGAHKIFLTFLSAVEKGNWEEKNFKGFAGMRNFFLFLKTEMKNFIFDLKYFTFLWRI